jgi:hypothetical protein
MKRAAGGTQSMNVIAKVGKRKKGDFLGKSFEPTFALPAPVPVPVASLRHRRAQHSLDMRSTYSYKERAFARVEDYDSNDCEVSMAAPAFSPHGRVLYRCIQIC